MRCAPKRWKGILRPIVLLPMSQLPRKSTRPMEYVQMKTNIHSAELGNGHKVEAHTKSNGLSILAASLLIICRVNFYLAIEVLSFPTRSNYGFTMFKNFTTNHVGSHNIQSHRITLRMNRKMLQSSRYPTKKGCLCLHINRHHQWKGQRSSNMISSHYNWDQNA